MALGFSPQGSEFRVNTTTALYQADPSVSGLADGGYVIVWGAADSNAAPETEADDIWGQRYDATGNTVGSEFLVNTYTSSYQINPVVTSLANGGFVVVWASNGVDGAGLGISSQRFRANGTKVGNEVQVNTFTTDHQYAPSVTTLSDGGYVVVWHSEGQSGGIFAQRFTSKSVAVGNEFQVNTSATGYLLDTYDYRDNVAVTAFDTGGFVVTWVSETGGGIFGQRFDATGNSVGTEFQIHTTTAHWQGAPAVAALSDGSFIVIWQSDQDGNQLNNDIFGQRFDETGAPVGGEIQINTFTNSDQINPAVTALADGGFVVAWGSRDQDGSGDGIFAQRYDASGHKVGGETQINTYISSHQKDVAISTLANGGFVISWESVLQDGDQKGVYAQQFEAQLFGTSSKDKIVDSVGANWIDGRAGNDKLIGKGGADKLFGGKGNDILRGDGGSDILKGQGGRDTLIGGAGKDILTGGAKADTFVFKSMSDSTADSNADVVKDFKSGVDHIDISAVSSGLVFIGTSSFSNSSEVRATLNTAGNTVVRIDVDGDGAADMKIILEGVAGVTAGDFIL